MEQPVQTDVNFCALCLDQDVNHSFGLLDDYKRGTLEIVSRELNFFKPYMLTCPKCAEKLHKCFNFKSNCMENEDYLLNFVKDNGDRIDLNTVIVQNDKSTEHRLFQKAHMICRICFQPTGEESFVGLDHFDSNLILKEMLNKCLPDMNLQLTKCPVACFKCIESIQNVFSFVKNCLKARSLPNGYSQFDMKIEICDEYVKEEPYNDKSTSDASEMIEREKEPSDVESSKIVCIDMYHCYKCSYKCNEANQIREHINRVHESYIIKSNQCEFCNKSNVTVPTRIRQKDATSSKYQCPFCDFKTCCRSNMVAHRKIHVNSLPYKCDICSKRFIEKNQLDEHLLKNHQDEVDLDKIITSKVHRCGVCSYKSTNASHLTRHLVTHNKNEAEIFRCKMCPYFCHDKHNFNAHSKKHKNPKLFSCSACGKRAGKKQNLDAHILSKHCHDNEMMKILTSKVHSCTICCYRTVNKYIMTTHMRTHKLA